MERNKGVRRDRKTNIQRVWDIINPSMFPTFQFEKGEELPPLADCLTFQVTS